MNKSLELLKNSKKNNIHDEMLVDVWLEEFFNITIEELKTDSRFYKKDGTAKDDVSRKFYTAFQVTEEQYNWWETTMLEILPKLLKISKKYFKRSWCFMSLNCAPMIKTIKTEKII